MKKTKRNKLIKGLLIGGMIIFPFPLSGILLLAYIKINKKKEVVKNSKENK